MKKEDLIIKNIPISGLQISECNVRKEHDDNHKITELAKSIEEEGILQPLLVRPENGKYGIIIGSRRYSAAKKINLKDMPVTVKELEDGESYAISLTENLQRNDLEPYEISRGIVDALHHMKGQKLADKLGLRNQYVYEMAAVFPVTGKIEASGIKVKAYPKEEECNMKKAIPLQHVLYIAGAFRNPKVQRLFGKPDSEDSLEAAKDAAKVMTHITQKQAKLVMDVYAEDPEANIEELVRQAEEGTLYQGKKRRSYRGDKGEEGVDIAKFEQSINEHTTELCFSLSNIWNMPQPTDDVEVDYIRKSRTFRKLLISELDPMHRAGIHSRLNYLNALIEETMEEIEKVQKKE